MRTHCRHCLLALVAFGAVNAAAQTGTLRGRVVEDSVRTPIAGAQLEIRHLNLSTRSDSLGRFRLAAVPFGEYRLVTRRLGFRTDTVVVELDVDDFELIDIRLRRAPQILAGVNVEGEVVPLADRISGFEERRRMGIGTFIDRGMLEKYGTMRTSDVIAALAPGVSVRRGNSLKAWAASGRNRTGPRGAFQGNAALDRADVAAGARPACYMDVYLNGVLVYNSSGDATPLFDLNSLQPDQIESIEAYPGASQIPARFNRTSGGCGVLVIWMKT